MSEFDIEEYLNSLPEDITQIIVSDNELTYLPDLSRFINLRELYCENNNLTELPPLNENLKYLWCNNNKLTSLPLLNNNLEVLRCCVNNLTSLPQLNENLQILFCSDNQLTVLPTLNENLKILNCEFNNLTSLPSLNENLQTLFCCDNQLTSLPLLNENLQYFNCCGNNLPEVLINSGHISQDKKIVINRINRINNCRYRIMCLKYKKHFRVWLWIKVRLPKTEQKYHPDNLSQMLEENELDDVIDNW